MKHSRVYLTGHTGMVGSAVYEALIETNYTDVVTTELSLDLRNQEKVVAYVHDSKPHTIVVAAARVGGIMANAL